MTVEVNLAFIGAMNDETTSIDVAVEVTGNDVIVAAGFDRILDELLASCDEITCNFGTPLDFIETDGTGGRAGVVCDMIVKFFGNFTRFLIAVCT